MGAAAVPIEAAVDGLEARAFHWRLLALVGLVILLDGFDIQLAAFAGPSILSEWGIAKSTLAPAMAAALVGMALGTSIGGRLGDRIGRRPALLASVAWFGGFGMLTGLSGDVVELAGWRFVTGLGLGAAVPSATALVAEWMPPRLRGYAVTGIIVAVPCGGMLGAWLASWLIPAYGWRAAFVVGGALPLMTAIAMAAALPESPAYLVRRKVADGRLAALLARAGGRFPPGTLFIPRDPLAEERRVYGGALLRSSIGLGVAFFASMLALYACLSWIPVLLADAGLPVDQAIRGSMLFNLCGVIASFIAAWATPRLGSRATLLGICAAALAAVAAWGWLILNPGASATPLLIGVGAAGAGVLAMQVMLYGLAAHLFPVECRAAGIGYSASIGRLGAILSAFGGGIILSLPGGIAAFFILVALAIAVTAAGVTIVDRHIPGRTPLAAREEMVPNDT